MRKLLLLLLLLSLTGAAAAGNGTLTPSSDRGPVRLNLSLLFQYDEAAPLSWQPLLEEASKLLYDATDKQMQLGNVTLYVNAPQMKANADGLISDDPTKGASAFVFGFGHRNLPMFYSQIHKSTSGRARGQMGFVHELGHYVFGMYDEYAGSEARATGSDLPVLEGAKRFFCTQPEAGGLASIMDAGTTTANNGRTEFCWRGNHNTGRFQPADEEGESGRIYRNKQQLQRQRSCWDQAVVAMRGWRIELIPPTQDPVSDITGHLPINVTVQRDVVPRTVLLLDGSAEVKKAAASALDGMNDGTSVAVVALGSPATTVFNLTVLDAASRTRAQDAIGSLTGTGATDFDAALRLGLGQLAARTPRGGNESLLVVTGTTVTPSAATTAELRSARVMVNWTTVGEGIDLAPLQALARATGGGGQAAPTADQAEQAVEEEARVVQGDQPLDFATGTLAPGQSASGTVLADTFLTALSFEVGPGVELTVTDPRGRTLLPTVSDEDGMAFDVPAPEVGLWSYTVSNRGAATTEFDFEAFGTDVTTGVEADGEDQVAFPRAQRFEVAVFAGDGGVQGAAVNGTVIRPDGTTVTLTLYDDGSAGHGDAEAHDGLYSNYFGAFQGSGIYALDATARNSNGRTTVSDDQDSDQDSPQVVAPFQRLNSFGFEVDGVPASVGTGSLTVTALGPNRWSFAAGPGEGVLVTQVTVPLRGPGEGVLLVDKDESVRAPLVGDQATFADPVFVEAGETRVVEVDADREPSSAAGWLAPFAAPSAWLAPLAWLAAGLAGFCWAARRQPRRAPAWAGLMLLGLLAVSCGTESTDFVSAGGGAAAPQLQVTARGITSGRAIPVDAR